MPGEGEGAVVGEGAREGKVPGERKVQGRGMCRRRER